jgi:hypothetical protein
MEPGLLKFTCTDRLNETRSLEHKVDACEVAVVNNGEQLIEIKRYNRTLIDNLRLFQVEVNNLTSEFVNNEKKAVEDKVLSNEHLKTLNKKVKSGEVAEESSSEEEEEEEEETTADEEPACLKRAEPPEATDEQVEKRLCV